MPSKSTPTPPKTYTHSELCAIAVRWLQKSFGVGGHGCTLAVSEVKSGYDGEIPDAIGWRCVGEYSDGCTVVECKTSRADFLADMKKNHRQDSLNRETDANGQLGLGKWRYFLAPEGIIKPEELPRNWGLLTLTKRGNVKVLFGASDAFALENTYEQTKTILDQWACESDRDRESYVLVKLFKKLGSTDIEKINLRMKESMARFNRLANKYNELNEKHRTLRSRYSSLRWQHIQLVEKTGAQENTVAFNDLEPASTYEPVLYTQEEGADPQPASSKKTHTPSWEEHLNNIKGDEF